MRAGHGSRRVTDTERFQGAEPYYQHGEVQVTRATDPLTGLPVLVYTFPAAPAAGASELESEHIPGVLATSTHGGTGRLVTAYSPRYVMVAPGESTVDDALAIAFARALTDAASVGVVHGDLRPGRLWFDRDHLLVEGFGVPWGDPALRTPTHELPPGESASGQGDVYALAATLHALGEEGLSLRCREVLAQALASDPSLRPSAADLHQALTRTLVAVPTPAPARQHRGAVTAPSQSFDELMLPVSDGSGSASGTPLPSAATYDDPLELLDDEAGSIIDAPVPTNHDPALELGDDAPGAWGGDGAGAAVTGPAGFVQPTAQPPVPPSGKAEGFTDEPEPITVTSDPGIRMAVDRQDPERKAAPPKPAGFVRELPPGATYRAGNLDAAAPAAPIRLDRREEVEAPRRSWRAPLFLLAVLVVAAALLALVFVNRDVHVPTPVSRGAVNYLVDVQVAPAGLPPVTLTVVSSPAGSSTPAGTILGNAPRKVLLDRPGEWVLRGSLQGRQSEPATLRLPEERAITVVFPDLPTEPDR